MSPLAMTHGMLSHALLRSLLAAAPHRLAEQLALRLLMRSLLSAEFRLGKP
jgi:hypothetical protein